MPLQPCENCPCPEDCTEHEKCIHEAIAKVFGSDVSVTTELAEFTDYTEAANISETALPYIDDSEDEDYTCAGF